MNKYLVFCFCISFLISCNIGGSFSGANLLGQQGELLVVLNNEYTNTELSAQINSLLNQPEKGLIQSEPPFSVLTISRNHFSSALRPHRNILFIDVHAKHVKPIIQFHRNMWTAHQAYVGIVVPHADSLVPFLETYRSAIIDYFIAAELERYLAGYKTIPNKQVQETIRKKFNISLDIPKGFKLNVIEDGFAWISLESAEHSQGIIIYERPYTDTMQLEKWSILRYRDSLLKKYIPGPTAGSFMTTEYILPIQYKIGRYILNSYTVELLGKWRVENDFMAGPFASYTFVDESQKKVFTIDGYVYYPNMNKRNYTRQLQAICRSVQTMNEIKK